MHYSNGAYFYKPMKPYDSDKRGFGEGFLKQSGRRSARVFEECGQCASKCEEAFQKAPAFFNRVQYFKSRGGSGEYWRNSRDSILYFPLVAAYLYIERAAGLTRPATSNRHSIRQGWGLYRKPFVLLIMSKAHTHIYF